MSTVLDDSSFVEETLSTSDFTSETLTTTASTSRTETTSYRFTSESTVTSGETNNDSSPGSKGSTGPFTYSDDFTTSRSFVGEAQPEVSISERPKTYTVYPLISKHDRKLIEMDLKYKVKFLVYFAFLTLFRT